MSSLFLDESLAAAEPGEVIVLSGAEAKHAVAVTRLRAGEATTIGNGRGLLASGPVVRAEPGRLEVRVERVEHLEPPSPRVVLVQALAKGGRDELAVQAATELGADAIIPWAAARSVSRWVGDKRARGVARWASIAREAAKQSVRAWVPRIHDLHTLDDLAALAGSTRMLVLEPTAALPLTRVPGPHPESSAARADIVLVVGPEGGMEDAERARLAAAGASEVRLGDTVLRTSTAGPAAIALVSALPALAGRW